MKKYKNFTLGLGQRVCVPNEPRLTVHGIAVGVVKERSFEWLVTTMLRCPGFQAESSPETGHKFQESHLESMCLKYNRNQTLEQL